MGKALFDTSVVPHWRQVGVVTLTGATRVLAGDPCYGHLDPVEGVELDAGTWLWEVRDADEHGSPEHRVWEVRLRRADVEVSDDWGWSDEYGQWVEQPAAGATLAGYRGVDTGTMAWQLSDEERSATVDLDTLLWAAGPSTHLGGRAFVSSTGWGDGGYPLAMRRAAAGVAEVRMVFITPDPARVTAGQFRSLVAGLFPQLASGAQVTLHLERTTYVSHEDGDPAKSHEHTYDTLRGVTVPSAHLAFGRVGDDFHYDEGPTDVVAAMSWLWGRLPQTERGGAVFAQSAGQSVERAPQGWIVSQEMTPVEVTLVP